MFSLCKIMVILAILSGTCLPTYASAPSAQQPTLKEQAQELSIYYHTDFKTINKVIICESNWDSASTGDHGKANGISQFHKDTFIEWSKQMGETLDYNSSYDQLKVMNWAFSKGNSYRRAWTCYNKLIK